MDGDTHDRQVRVGRNQSLFRAVNEQVEGLRNSSYPDTEIDFICECFNDACFSPLTLTIGEYEAAREQSHRFLVSASPEHVEPEAEVVVDQHAHYWVAEKFGAAGRVAEATDTRHHDD